MNSIIRFRYPVRLVSDDKLMRSDVLQLSRIDPAAGLRGTADDGFVIAGEANSLVSDSDTDTTGSKDDLEADTYSMEGQSE
jgi:hypothetical protein